MTDTGPGTPQCAAVQEDLAELALGSLGGRQRAVVLGHLEGCARCAEELEELALAADALLGVAPSIDPPVGFEVRVFDQLGVTARKRFARLRQAKVSLVAAAAAVAGLSFGGGLLVAGGNPATVAVSPALAVGTFASATLASHGRSIGLVSTYGGSPSWILMIVRDAGATGEVKCYVTLSNGKTAPVGAFWLSNGYGGWSSPLTMNASRVTGAHIVGADGTLLASATLRT